MKENNYINLKSKEKMSKNFRKELPVAIVNRVLCMQAIKEIGADKIHALGEKYSMFLVQYEDGISDVHYDIDWEFALFEATEFQLSSLIDNFQAKPIAQKAEDTVNKVLEERNKKTLLFTDTDIQSAKEFAKEEETILKIVKDEKG